MKISSYFNYSLLFLSLFLMYGCTKDNETGLSDCVELIANLSVNSKIAYNSANGMTSVSWVAGDIVGVCTKDPLNIQYIAKNSATQTPLEPSGTMELKVNEGDQIVAYYPYIDDLEYANRSDFLNEGGVPFKYFGTQYQKDGLWTYDCLYAKGVVEDNKVNLQFRHLLSILKITFPIEMVSNLFENQLMFVSTENISSWGDNSYNPETKKFGRHNGADLKTDILYILDSDSLKGESVTCSIVMIPQSESAQITIKDNPNWPDNPKVLQIFKVPQGGFKSGHIYKLDLTTDNRYIKDEGSIDSMPELEW